MKKMTRPYDYHLSQYENEIETAREAELDEQTIEFSYRTTPLKEAIDCDS
jgi:hypothetical protein